MSDRKVLAKGMFWSAVEKYSSIFVSTIISMVLARILTPAEFGTVAIATVLIHFLTMVSNMGIAPAIIQRRDLTEVDYNNIFTFSCIVGIALGLLFFFGSWGIAKIYDVSDLVPICQILSIQVFFSAANMVPNALMTKNLRFKEIAKRTLMLQLITGAISIVAALLGAGVFSLLISPVITAIGIFIYNRHFYKVEVSRQFSLNPIKKIFSYSSYQFLFEFIAYFSANIDSLLIGKYISAADLGYYQKSYQLVQRPLNSVSGVVAPVLQPVLSKYQDDKLELSRRYNKVLRLVATIAFPLGVLAFFCGAEIIRIFFGNQWDLAVPCFKIISLAMPFQLILNCTGGFFMASNDTKSLFLIGLINAIISIVFISIAVLFYKTIESVAIAWGVSRFLFFIITYAFMYLKVLKLPFYLVIKEFTLPIGVALLLAAILYAEGLIFPNQIIINLVVKGFTAAALVAVTIQTSKQLDIIGVVKNRLSKKKNPDIR